jgi:hypothetical protein
VARPHAAVEASGPQDRRRSPLADPGIASDKGTWGRLLYPPVEGKPMSGFAGMNVGQKLGVRLTGTDVECGFIDFERVG